MSIRLHNYTTLINLLTYLLTYLPDLALQYSSTLEARYDLNCIETLKAPLNPKQPTRPCSLLLQKVIISGQTKQRYLRMQAMPTKMMTRQRATPTKVMVTITRTDGHTHTKQKSTN